MPSLIPIEEGFKSNDWTIIKQIKGSIVICRCKCGNIRRLDSKSIREERSKKCRSCGSREGNTRHGEGGKNRSPEFNTWMYMKGRAGKRKHYLDVSVHSSWKGKNGYKSFLKCVGRKPTPKHELDRINPFGNYVPGNVRWATHTEQIRNRRAAKAITQ